MHNIVELICIFSWCELCVVDLASEYLLNPHKQFSTTGERRRRRKKKRRKRREGNRRAGLKDLVFMFNTQRYKQDE